MISWARRVKLIAWLWTAAVVAISLQPLRPHHGSALSRMHRPLHFLLFGITALILWRLFVSVDWPRIPKLFAARPWLVALLSTAALGTAIELLQHLIYRDRMEWWDVRDDSLAAIGAVLPIMLTRSSTCRLLHLRPQPASSPPPASRLR